MKVAFHTLGCKVNQNDTESLMAIFEKRGYEIVPFEPGADIYVINTCAVTATGAQKSRQIIRKAVGFNAQVVVATGCYPQVSPEEAANVEGVNLLVGMAERPRIVDLVEAYLREQKNRLQIETAHSDMWIDLPQGNGMERTRAVLKIEEGCEQFCTYCIIPYARGKVRSMPPGQVIANFQALLRQGYKEVVLTGIHLGAYGRDLQLSLVDILKDLLAIEGDFRIRLGSVEPTDFSEELIAQIGANSKICKYLHIPLQSGSDPVLQRMHRGYSLDYFSKLLQRLRAGNPLLGIGTDLMVGFPGETAEDFQSTCRFLYQQAFSRLHVFRYSPRPGTPAATMPGRVPQATMEARSQEVIGIAAKLSHAYAQRFIGTSISVLFEEKAGNYWMGTSGEYLRVKVKTDVELRNSCRYVTVTDVDPQNVLIGELARE